MPLLMKEELPSPRRLNLVSRVNDLLKGMRVRLVD